MSIFDVHGKKSLIYLSVTWILAVVLFVFFMVLAFQPKTVEVSNQKTEYLDIDQVGVATIIVSITWDKQTVSTVHLQMDPKSKLQCEFSKDTVNPDKKDRTFSVNMQCGTKKIPIDGGIIQIDQDGSIRDAKDAGIFPVNLYQKKEQKKT